MPYSESRESVKGFIEKDGADGFAFVKESEDCFFLSCLTTTKRINTKIIMNSAAAIEKYSSTLSFTDPTTPHVSK